MMPGRAPLRIPVSMPVKIPVRITVRIPIRIPIKSRVKTNLIARSPINIQASNPVISVFAARNQIQLIKILF